MLDRGFIFGDGVYELVPVYSRVPFRLDEHLARLERSLGEARIRNPYSRAEWRGIIHGLIDAQPFEDQGVYFQVTRGVAKRDHAFPKDVEPTVFMMANPLVNPPQAQVERGGCRRERAGQPLAALRHQVDLAHRQLLLRQLSAEAGAAETILFRDGKLTEASASNVFIVKRGVILSPPKSNLILPGITYDVIAELAHADELPLEFRRSARPKCAPPTRSGSRRRRRKCFPIVSLDGKPVGDGKPGPRVPPHVPALPGVQAEGDARRQARGDLLPEVSRSAFPCDFPIKIMGRKERGFAQALTEIVLKHAPDFDAGERRDAPQPPRQVPQPHLRRARHLARAARRALPGTLRPSLRGHGALMVLR